MSWGWLWVWRSGRRRPDLDHWHVVLFTRKGCHLCEKAWEQLKAARLRYGFTLGEVDVDTDPALAAEHGSHVPVVVVNGKVRFRGVVNPILLERLFKNTPPPRGRGELTA
jgi:glutaredoxin